MPNKNKVITVITKHSIYRFSKAEKGGKRTVFREKEPLDFTKCKILSCSWGKYGT